MLDVCGHGVPAALITVAVSQFLHSRRSHPELFREMDAPAKILSQLNQAFPFSRFETYFSIINMAIDGTEGQLIYGNAGHPPPILLMRNGGTRLLEHHGPVIGVSDQHIYEQRVVDLTPGDRVILYTDGLLDVTNNDNEFFGKFRFIDLLEKLRDVPLQEMADTVQWKIKQFSAGNAPEDDITFLAIQYDG
jgi:sigma-B regulation protein RsbU (phosphoserine phosphatase)